MAENEVMSRKDALNQLKRLGIAGEQVYMIDFIPLIEIMWADGHAQPGEVAILEDYIEKHVQHVNELAGCSVLRVEDARAFVSRFLETRPSPDLLSTLRKFVKPVRFSSGDNEQNKKLRESLLCACMDIASSSVTEYPYGIQERFNPAEKMCFFSIMESMSDEGQPCAAIQHI